MWLKAGRIKIHVATFKRTRPYNKDTSMFYNHRNTLPKSIVSRTIVMTLACLLLCACTSNGAHVSKRDPFENFNRHTYRMNDKLDKVILKPIASGYKTIIPSPLRKGIYNFFTNLDEVPNVINDLLQLQPQLACNDGGRFVVNSTLGLLGFLDIASPMGLAHNDQDFGQTLGRWGYGNSRYVVIPLLGPSTLRDVIGRPIDYSLFSVLSYVYPVHTRNRLIATDFISERAALLGTEKVLANSFDPYAFVRDSYLQKREQLIAEKRGQHLAHSDTKKTTLATTNNNDPFVPADE